MADNDRQFYMRRLALPAAALLAAIAAWLSVGTLALATPDGPRIALLPVSASALAAAAVVAAAIVALARAGASLTPLWILTLAVIPWLPVPLPAAFLIWAGSMRWLVWMAAGLLMCASIDPRRWRPRLSLAIFRDRPQLSAGICAFAIYAVSAWFVSPSIPGGDEPHYLIITQSLLLDHDLKIENNHRRGDYQSYISGQLAPHYIARGRNGEIYSIHAPGLSALVAPAFAIAGYHGVVLFLLLVAACGSALTWHVAWLATRSSSAAWFGWAAVTLSATTIFHTFTVYPDGVGGLLVLTGVWALLRAEQERANGSARALPWLLHGLALAALPWLHSRFAFLAGTLGALALLRLSPTKNPAGKAVAFLSIPTISAICWLGMFVVIYGTPDPAAPYGTTREFSLSFIPGGLAGLLFDERFGLLANAPVLVCAIGGLGMMLRSRQRLGFELLFVTLPYLLTATSYAMWWAGWSAPARFANPAVPILAIPCAVAWQRMRHRATRLVAAGALALTAFISGVLVVTDGGRLAYNTRESTALWLDWASRLTSLGEGVPLWMRGRDAEFIRDIVVWIAALLLAWLVARAIEGKPALTDRTRLATVIAALFAAAAMLAVTLVWNLRDVEGVRAGPAQLELLRHLADDRGLAFSLTPPRRVSQSDVLSMMRIESAPRIGVAGGLGRNEQPLIALPTIPAGRYRVLTRTTRPGGWLLIGVAQDQFALKSEPLAWPPKPIEIDFPVAVRALLVRGDEDARRGVRSIVVEPLSLMPRAARVTDAVARRAVKYSDASVFFLDDRAFPEPDAFWIGGSRETTVVLQPDQARLSIALHVRNAPVENRVTFASGQWHEALTLTPGEERTIKVPIAPGSPAALVTMTSAFGFRPSETVPESRDQRFLGAWIKVGS
jgi:hypothetical protein